MTQHTPGPWTFEHDWNGFIQISANGRHIGSLPKLASGTPGSGIPVDQHGKEQEANARLIAAAPELETVASSFEIKGPDADGLLWLILTDPARGNRAAFNLGRNEGIASGAALGLENARRAAIAKATGSP